jgi:uncharacterized protein YggE
LQIGAWLLIAVLVLTAGWLMQNIGRTNEAPNASNTITINGTGTVTAVPDVAVATIAISVEGSTAKAAQNDANKKSVAVVDYLKKAGIKEADIKTSGYNINPQYDYSSGKNIIHGYQVTQSLTVKIRDMDKANTILDGVVSAGANQVNGLSFEIDKPDQLKADARKKAIDDANKKARELEDQLGVDLGHIVSFTESGDYYPPLRYAKDMMMSAGSGVSSSIPVPELPAGENEITMSVSITYQIK